MEAYDHLSVLDLADSSDGQSRLEVDVLIGSDQYWQLTSGQIRRGSSGPIAIHTGLGWVLSGPVSLLNQDEAMTGFFVSHTLRVDRQLEEGETLDKQLKSFWELESLGITNPDQSVYDRFGDTVIFEDGRYEVALPWKDPHPILPDNYQLSLKRLQRDCYVTFIMTRLLYWNMILLSETRYIRELLKWLNILITLRLKGFTTYHTMP